MKRILRYASDLHLERYNKIYDAPQICKFWEFDKDHNTKYNLALLGDIGYPNSANHDEFLKNVSEKYDNIFYVPGNHEYYQHNIKIKNTVSQVKRALQAICAKYNIILLDNETYMLDEFKIIGTTLWSHVPSSKKRYIRQYINDYRRIINDDHDPITVCDTNRWNLEAIKFIESNLDNEKCIVLSHHAPLFSNEEKNQYTARELYFDSPNNSAFHNDLEWLLAEPIKVWLYGHTHHAGKFEANGVIVATNQMGYEYESDFIPFDPEVHINLDEL